MTPKTCLGRTRLAAGAVGGALAAASVLLATVSAQNPGLPQAAAPVDIVLKGLAEASYVTAGPDDLVYISEEKTGRVLRVGPEGITAVLTDLIRPRGLAADAWGNLYVASRALRLRSQFEGVILRLDANGVLWILASGLPNPNALAVLDDGTLYVSVDGDEHEPGGLLRLGGTETLPEAIGGFRNPRGLTVADGQLLVAADGFDGLGVPGASGIFRLDPTTGHVSQIVGPLASGPQDVAVDRLGAIFFSSEAPEGLGEGYIGKQNPDGSLLTFAFSMSRPRGLTFDSRGNLYVAEDGEEAGRLLRFQAPLAPELDPSPAFTNQNPFWLSATTEATARLTVSGGTQPDEAVADDHGNASVAVLLRPNAPNHLRVVATGSEGRGLTGAPAETTIVHDDTPPQVTISSPSPGQFVGGPVTVIATATDENDIDSLTVLTPPGLMDVDPAPDRFSATFDARALPNGPLAISVRATDRAGNSWVESVTVTVSNDTPIALPLTVTTDEDVPALFQLPGYHPLGHPFQFFIRTVPVLGRLYQVLPDNVTPGAQITHIDTIVTNPDGWLYYVPPPDYNGSQDRLRFNIMDAHEVSSPFVFVPIIVLPVNDPPVAFPMVHLGLVHAPPSTILLNVWDIDGLEDVTIHFTSFPEGGRLYQGQDLPAPERLVTPENSVFPGSQRIFTFYHDVPPDHESRDFTFTFYVTDSEFQTDEVRDTIRVISAPGSLTPRATHLPDLVTTCRNTPISIIPTGEDPDGDDSLLSFELLGPPKSGQEAHGRLAIRNLTGAIVPVTEYPRIVPRSDPLTGWEVVYLPPDDFTTDGRQEPVSFSFDLRDELGHSALETYRVPIRVAGACTPADKANIVLTCPNRPAWVPLQATAAPPGDLRFFVSEPQRGTAAYTGTIHHFAGMFAPRTSFIAPRSGPPGARHTYPLIGVAEANRTSLLLFIPQPGDTGAEPDRFQWSWEVTTPAGEVVRSQTYTTWVSISDQHCQ
jgi:hypothetical protein